MYLHSPDVIHAFYVPQFLFKRDVVPGVQNQFDLDDPGGRRGPDLPRPVRRAVRDRPPDHDCSRSMRSPRPTSRPGTHKQVAAANATPPPAPSGAAAGPTIPLIAQGVSSTSRRSRHRRPGSRSTSTTRTPGTPHDVDILDGAGAKVFDSTDVPRRRRRRTSRSRRCRRERTSSSARSTRP